MMIGREKRVEVDDLSIRYLEEGRGPVVLLLHGASLGSSADVWEPVLAPLAGYGFRVIAYDQPGFGLSDNPADYSVGYRQRFILDLMDALNIVTARLIGHSQAGRMAVALAWKYPERILRVVVLGTGSLLPPLPGGEKSTGAREGDEGTDVEPTLEETRALLERDLFDHSLITPEALETRHRMSIGKNFQAFLARRKAAEKGGEKEAVPLWQRVDKVPVPLLLLYGKNDRASAGERAALAKERYPHLPLYLLDRCKHLAQWDAAKEFVELAGGFLTG